VTHKKYDKLPALDKLMVHMYIVKTQLVVF